MFFYNLLQSTMEQRRSGKVAKRNDLVDMMLEAIADDGESGKDTFLGKGIKEQEISSFSE